MAENGKFKVISLLLAGKAEENYEKPITIVGVSAGNRTQKLSKSVTT